MKRLIILLLAFNTSVQAEVYKWVDDKGKIHYSDEKPEGQQVLEEDVEIKNNQMQFMDENDQRLLDSFDAQRKEEQKQRPEIQAEQKESDKAADSASLTLEDYQCFELSPAVTPTGISYLDINPRKLTDGQIEMLEELFQHIEGDWRGTGEGFDCFGTEAQPEKRTTEYRIEVEASIGISTALRFVADLASRGEGLHQRDIYLFHIEEEMLRLGSPGKAGDIELSHLTEDGFRVYQKQWQGRAGRGRTFVENLIQISLEDKRLVLEHASFHQGVLGSMKIMELRKF